jgi:hypothetical protein
MRKQHMLEKPYIKKVLLKLESMGHTDAKKVLFRFYRIVRRSWGFYPNACDFAGEIDSLYRAVNRTYNAADPNQIYIGHLRERVRSSKQISRRGD